jgi:hypothetical protein
VVATLADRSILPLPAVTAGDLHRLAAAAGQDPHSAGQDPQVGGRMPGHAG